jgi:hypothetical protein
MLRWKKMLIAARTDLVQNLAQKLGGLIATKSTYSPRHSLTRDRLRVVKSQGGLQDQ